MAWNSRLNLSIWLGSARSYLEVDGSGHVNSHPPSCVQLARLAGLGFEHLRVSHNCESVTGKHHRTDMHLSFLFNTFHYYPNPNPSQPSCPGRFLFQAMPRLVMQDARGFAGWRLLGLFVGRRSRSWEFWFCLPVQPNALYGVRGVRDANERLTLVRAVRS